MKTNQISRYATALALASLAALVSACGSGSNSSNQIGLPGTYGGGGGQSVIGNPQACVLPLTQNVGFGAQNAQMGYTTISASPTTGAITTLMGGAFAQGYQYSNSWNTAVSDAYVGLNIAVGGYGGYPTTGYGGGYPTTGYGGTTVQGALTMTQLRWQTILLELEQKYPYGFNPTYGGAVPPGAVPTYGAQGVVPPGICINAVAFNLIYGPGTIQGGDVQLLLNTNDTITLQF